MLLSDCGRWASALVSGHEQTSSAFLPDLLQYTRFLQQVFSMSTAYLDTKAPSAIEAREIAVRDGKERRWRLCSNA